MGKSPEFRRFVLQVFSHRWLESLHRIYSVAFLSVDQRIAEFLIEHPDTVYQTQQEIADEIGTAREVASRVLKRFQELGAIRLFRGGFQIKDRQILERVVRPFG